MFKKIIFTIVMMMCCITIVNGCGKSSQDVFDKFSEDKELALDDYNKLSGKNKEEVNNQIKSKIEQEYKDDTGNIKESYNRVSDEISKYTGIDALSSYREEMRDKINSRYNYYDIVNIIDDGSSLKTLDLNELDNYIKKIKSVSTDSEYYDDSKITYAILVDAYNQRSVDKITINKVSPKIGMSKAEVAYMSTWGKPKKINKTTTKQGTNEQWVYSGNRYVYFNDNEVTSMQE